MIIAYRDFSGFFEVDEPELTGTDPPSEIKPVLTPVGTDPIFPGDFP